MNFFRGLFQAATVGSPSAVFSSSRIDATAVATCFKFRELGFFYARFVLVLSQQYCRSIRVGMEFYANRRARTVEDPCVRFGQLRVSAAKHMHKYTVIFM